MRLVATGSRALTEAHVPQLRSFLGTVLRAHLPYEPGYVLQALFSGECPSRHGHPRFRWREEPACGGLALCSLNGVAGGET